MGRIGQPAQGAEQTKYPDGGRQLARALDRGPTDERPRFADGRLVGGRCRDCRTVVWPARAVCHRCGGTATEDVPLASTAALLSFTEVHVARPGLQVPYTLGQVRVDDGGPLLFGLVRGLTEPVRLPCAVEIVVPGRTEGSDPPYWFQAAGA